MTQALRDKIARIVTLDHIQLLTDYDVDADLYRKDPEALESSNATAGAILSVIAESVPDLEWDWPCEYGMICQAKTPIGTYSIHQDEDSAGGALLMYLHLTDDGDCTRYAVEWREYVEPEEFQAIAQADNTRRILSGIGLSMPEKESQGDA